MRPKAPTPSSAALASTQAAFLDGLAAPLAGASRDEAGFPGWRQPARLAIVNALTAGATLDAAARFEVYHRQYWYRLMDSLLEDFPKLDAALGRDAFWALMEQYLLAHPPRDYSLRTLGAELAGFMAGPAGRTLPRQREFVDVACIEYALCEVFEAPAATALSPVALAEAPLGVASTVRLLQLSGPLASYWPELGAALYVAVVRVGYARQVVPLASKAYRLLRAIATAGSMATAIDALVEEGTLTDADATDVTAWLATWQAEAWLTAR